MSRSRLALGVDVGATRVKAALIDATGALRQWRMLPTASLGTTQPIAAVADLCRTLCDAQGVSIDDVATVGLSIPGPVNPRSDRAAACVNLPGWGGEPVGAVIEALLGRPTFLENDANAACFGEYSRLRAANPDLRDIALVVVSTGIGGGLVCDGRLLRGAYGLAGELGHCVIVPGGRPCPCGQQGCLEQYASALAVASRYRELSPSGTIRHPADARSIVAAALTGDAAAAQVLDEAIYYLALGCVTIARMTDPSIIVLGGGVANAGPRWLALLRAALEKVYWTLPTPQPEVRLAELGDRAGAVGAALLALEHLSAMQLQC